MYAQGPVISVTMWQDTEKIQKYKQLSKKLKILKLWYRSQKTVSQNIKLLDCKILDCGRFCKLFQVCTFGKFWQKGAKRPYLAPFVSRKGWIFRNLAEHRMKQFSNPPISLSLIPMTITLIIFIIFLLNWWKFELKLRRLIGNQPNDYRTLHLDNSSEKKLNSKI